MTIRMIVASIALVALVLVSLTTNDGVVAEEFFTREAVNSAGVGIALPSDVFKILEALTVSDVQVMIENMSDKQV